MRLAPGDSAWHRITLPSVVLPPTFVTPGGAVCVATIFLFLTKRLDTEFASRTLLAGLSRCQFCRKGVPPIGHLSQGSENSGGTKAETGFRIMTDEIAAVFWFFLGDRLGGGTGRITNLVRKKLDPAPPRLIFRPFPVAASLPCPGQQKIQTGNFRRWPPALPARSDRAETPARDLPT